MQTKTFAYTAAMVFAAAITIPAAPASALTMQECSAKYNAAKAGNTLGSMSWNDFRKSQCGEGAAPAAAAPAPAQTPAGRTATQPSTRAATPAPASTAVFPRALDRKYSAETPAKQRMKTCLDQYNANKANGGNADLKWIQKGGGYYSQCNARMKQVQGV